MDLRDPDFTQKIRLLDIAVIGPLMIYAGVKGKDELPEWVRGVLILLGATTIGYNLINYLAISEEESEKVWERIAELAKEEEAEEST